MKHLHWNSAKSGWAFLLFLLMGLALSLQGQTPQDIPKLHENEPLDVDNLPKLIIYIIIPVVAILLYFILKRRRRNRER